jgi:hypothetical protein
VAAAAGAAAPAAGADPDDDEFVVVAGAGKVKVTTLLAKVRSAFGAGGAKRSFRGLFELFLVRDLAGRLSEVLTLSGGSLHKIPPDMTDRFNGVIGPLRAINNNPGFATVPVEKCLNLMDPKFPPAEAQALITKYVSVVQAAAKGAVGTYDKYMPEALDTLAKRLFWEPRVKPARLVLKQGQLATFEVYVGCSSSLTSYHSRP